MNRLLLTLFYLFVPISLASGQWTKARQQISNLDSLVDSADELQRQIDQTGGLRLSRRQYRITKPLVIRLADTSECSVEGTRGCTLIMDGKGPAIQVIGTHKGTAAPKSFQPATWNQRMPIFRGFEILGANPQADGIELRGTVAATISQCSIRWCGTGIRLGERNRNVIVSGCHLYENSGAGILLDDVNLHQINIQSSHISYNRGGGIVIRDGNVRNIQVTGCDIEANMPDDGKPTRTANFLVDLTGSESDKSKSVAEISITGCTIQHSANYGGNDGNGVAPGGANIRLAGKKIYPIDSVTISGNVISDTSYNLDLDHCQDVVVNANNFFAPKLFNARVANSRRVNLVANTFNPRQFVRPGTIVFDSCEACMLTSSTLHRFDTEKGAVVMRDCANMLLSNLIFSECGSGIFLERSKDCALSNCRFSDLRARATEVRVDEASERIELQKR